MSITRRQSLEAKLSYLTIGLLFIIVFGLGHFTLSWQRAALVHEKKESFEGLAKVLSIALQPSMTQNHIALSRDLAKQLEESQAELEYVIITDQSGHTIFAESRRRTVSEQRLGILGHSTHRIISYLTATLNSDDTGVYRTRSPIRLSDNKQGSISVGFSLRRVNELMETLQQALLTSFAIAFILGILGSVMLARSITSQIRALSDGALKVMNNDLTVSVPVRTPDEVGALTQTFNEMVARLKENQERLEQRANTDSLTELYNHRFFQERLSEEIKRAERHSRSVALLMLDLDHFKNFNDTHGHPAGDAALKAVSQVLRQTVRDIDVVGRYGGEEFAVIMPECGLEDAKAGAERIRLAIQRHCFYGKNDETVPMTVSIGLAHYPEHSQEREGLIFAADVALYQSKSLGRNQVTCFTGTGTDGSEDTPYKFYIALHATELTTVESIAEAIDAKHGHPRRFSRSVAELAVKIGTELGMPTEDLNSVRIASLLRDVGQIGISDSILNKEGPLTEDERQILEAHPSLGHAIVERSPHFKAMMPGILHHHERWDGKGYPFKLSGEQIPLVARVVGIADAYRAMTVDRPHRKSMKPEQARAEILRCSGTQFDPSLVDILLKLEDTQQNQAA